MKDRLPSASADARAFGPFTLDVKRLELFRDGEPVGVQLQPLKLLALLVDRPGRVVDRDEIRDAIWGHDHIEVDPGINFCVARIRAALGDDARNPAYIETVPRRGYRFVSPVSTLAEPLPRSARGRRWTAAAAPAAIFGVAAWVGLPGRTVDAPPTGSPPSSVAADAVRRAAVYLDRAVSCETAEEAARWLRLAVETEPAFAPAHAKLAATLTRLAADDPGTRDEAEHHAHRALALAPELPDAHVALGHVLYVRGDRAGSARAFRAALALDPANAESREALAYLDREEGAWEDAIAGFEAAFARNPHSLVLAHSLAVTYGYLRRWDRVRERLADMQAIAPGHRVTRAQLALASLAERGDAEAAWTSLRAAPEEERLAAVLSSSTLSRVFADRIAPERRPELTPGQSDIPAELYAYNEWLVASVSGRRDAAAAARARARGALERAVRERSSIPSLRAERHALLADVYAAEGRSDEARAHLRAAMEHGRASRDAFVAARIRLKVAETHVRLGDLDRAAAEAVDLLADPSPLTRGLLRVDPAWSPLRGRLGDPGPAGPEGGGVTARREAAG